MSDSSHEVRKMINDSVPSSDDGSKGTNIVIGFEHLHASISGVVAERDSLRTERDEMERRARAFEQGATRLQRARDELLQERNEARAEVKRLRTLLEKSQ